MWHSPSDVVLRIRYDVALRTGIRALAHPEVCVRAEAVVHERLDENGGLVHGVDSALVVAIQKIENVKQQ